MAKLQTLPKNMKIIETAAGTFQQEKTRSRRKFKMSKKARNKISAAARKFKAPVLTIGALAMGTGQPIALLFQGQAMQAGQILLRNYTGFDIDGNGGVSWRFRHMFNGLFPLGAVMLLNRTGLLKPVNQKLARAGIPLRLS